MDIELNRQLLLLSEMSEVVHNYKDGKKIDFTRVNYEIEKLLHSAESCNKIVNNGIKLSDNDFYLFLNEFARITGWSQFDCQQVINMANGFKYDESSTLITSMQRVLPESGEIVRIYLDIIYNQKFNVDSKHVYSVEEIEKLVNQKKIIIVCEKASNIDYDKKYYRSEEYHSFECAYDEDNLEYEFFNEGGMFYPYTLMYIRKELSSDKIRKLISSHLNNVNDEISDVITDGGFASDYWTYVAHEYLKEFENQGYSKRLRRINERNKIL